MAGLTCSRLLHIRSMLNASAIDSTIVGGCNPESLQPDTDTLSNATAGDISHSTLQASSLTTALRKVNRVLLPLLFLATFFQNLGIGNLSYAALEMNKDLGISAEEFGVGAGLFFITFGVALLPSTYITMKVGGHYWLGALCAVRGLIGSCQAAVTSKAAFYALRLLLGLSEAGVGASKMHILAQFYPKAYHPKAVSIVNTMAATSSQVIAAPLAAGLMALSRAAGLAGWRWLFLIEGVPSVAVGVAIMIWLPDEPLKAWMLRADERQLLHEEVQQSKYQNTKQVGPCKPPADAQPSIKHFLTTICQTLTSVPVWICLAASLLWTMSGGGLGIWLPQMIHQMISQDSLSAFSSNGITANTAATLLSAVPYAAATILCWLLACSSQQFKEQTLHIAVPFALSSVLLLCMGPIRDVSGAAGYAALAVAETFAISCAGILMARYIGFLKVSHVGLGVACFDLVSSTGGVLGPVLVGVILQHSDGSCTLAAVALGAVLLTSAALILLLRLYEKHQQQQANSPAVEDLEEASLAEYTTSRVLQQRMHGVTPTSVYGVHPSPLQALQC